MGVTLAACAIALLPWLVRNQASVGCFTITTDSRALWKANNLATYDTLAAGKFIDDVPNLPGAPPWPELAADLTLAGTPTTADECAQMRLYRREVLDFWREHPGEKAKLMGQAARMLWDPRSLQTEGRPEAGTFVDDVRTWVQPLYMIPLFVLALDRLLPDPATPRGPVRRPARVQHARRARLRRRDALPGPVGLRTSLPRERCAARPL